MGSLLLTALSPFMRALLSWPNHFQRVLLNTITFSIMFTRCAFGGGVGWGRAGGDTNIQTIAFVFLNLSVFHMFTGHFKISFVNVFHIFFSFFYLIFGPLPFIFKEFFMGS